MTPHTQAAFVTSFVDREGRQPTPQEVWDAAIRSYRDLAQPAQAVPMKGTLNLSDPAVQKRLAAQWGYVQAPAPAPEVPAQALEQAEQPAPMSELNRLIAYFACEKLRSIGFTWDEHGKAWAAPQPEAQPRLTVRLCSFPARNGKRNWTALLVRAEKWGGLVGNCGGISVARGEYWNRVAYEAECAKLLIGERDTEPNILDYGDEIRTPEEWAGEKRGGRCVAAPSAQAESTACPHTGQCHPGFCPCSDAKRGAEQKGGE